MKDLVRNFLSNNAFFCSNGGWELFNSDMNFRAMSMALAEYHIEQAHDTEIFNHFFKTTTEQVLGSLYQLSEDYPILNFSNLNPSEAETRMYVLDLLAGMENKDAARSEDETSALESNLTAIRGIFEHNDPKTAVHIHLIQHKLQQNLNEHLTEEQVRKIVEHPESKILSHALLFLVLYQTDLTKQLLAHLDTLLNKTDPISVIKAFCLYCAWNTNKNPKDIQAEDFDRIFHHESPISVAKLTISFLNINNTTGAVLKLAKYWQKINRPNTDGAFDRLCCAIAAALSRTTTRQAACIDFLCEHTHPEQAIRVIYDDPNPEIKFSAKIDNCNNTTFTQNDHFDPNNNFHLNITNLTCSSKIARKFKQHTQKPQHVTQPRLIKINETHANQSSSSSSSSSNNRFDSNSIFETIVLNSPNDHLQLKLIDAHTPDCCLGQNCCHYTVTTSRVFNPGISYEESYFNLSQYFLEHKLFAYDVKTYSKRPNLVDMHLDEFSESLIVFPENGIIKCQSVDELSQIVDEHDLSFNEPNKTEIEYAIHNETPLKPSHIAAISEYIFAQQSYYDIQLRTPPALLESIAHQTIFLYYNKIQEQLKICVVSPGEPDNKPNYSPTMTINPPQALRDQLCQVLNQDKAILPMDLLKKFLNHLASNKTFRMRATSFSGVNKSLFDVYHDKVYHAITDTFSGLDPSFKEKVTAVLSNKGKLSQNKKELLTLSKAKLLTKTYLDIFYNTVDFTYNSVPYLRYNQKVFKFFTIQQFARTQINVYDMRRAFGLMTSLENILNCPNLRNQNYLRDDIFQFMETHHYCENVMKMVYFLSLSGRVDSLNQIQPILQGLGEREQNEFFSLFNRFSKPLLAHDAAINPEDISKLIFIIQNNDALNVHRIPQHLLSEVLWHIMLTIDLNNTPLSITNCNAQIAQLIGGNNIVNQNAAIQWRLGEPIPRLIRQLEEPLPEPTRQLEAPLPGPTRQLEAPILRPTRQLEEPTLGPTNRRSTHTESIDQGVANSLLRLNERHPLSPPQEENLRSEFLPDVCTIVLDTETISNKLQLILANTFLSEKEECSEEFYQLICQEIEPPEQALEGAADVGQWKDETVKTWHEKTILKAVEAVKIDFHEQMVKAKYGKQAQTKELEEITVKINNQIESHTCDKQLLTNLVLTNLVLYCGKRNIDESETSEPKRQKTNSESSSVIPNSIFRPTTESVQPEPVRTLGKRP